MIYIKSKIKIKVTGKNIDRFINRLIKHNINIYGLEYIDRKNIILIISFDEMLKIEKIKTIYKIKVLNYTGFKKCKYIIRKNSYIIVSLVIGFVFLKILTNMIFDIEVIHNNNDLREIIKTELEKNGISKFKFKKNYNQIKRIKDNILSKYKDKIEWLEIENMGTKYIVRLEERITTKIKKDDSIQNIISKYDALILSLEAESGEVVRNVGDYVHKGDVIISGNIMLNEEIKNTVKAKGNVYGEVWYKVSVEYPLHYYEKKITDESKKVLTFNFFNKKIELFNFKKYKNKEIKENIITKNNIFPIYLSLDTQTKITIIDEVYTIDQAVKCAKEKIKDEFSKQLSEKEYIIDIKKLKLIQNNSKIKVDFFVTVYKNITDIQKIDKIKESKLEE